MTEYKYRPPLIYLAIGLPIIFMAGLFGYMLFIISTWLWFIFLVLALLFLINGTMLISKYVMNIDIENIKIGDNFITVPVSSEKTVDLNFHQIKESFEIQFPEHSLAIRTNNSIYLIKRPWMNKKDFKKVKKKIENFPQQWL